MMTFIFWVLSTFVWTTLMSFFSTQEMACISYNRLKLEAASKRGDSSALKIKYMVDNPLLLFGTTLFGVNICLVVGSESARQAFASIGLSPNFSAFAHIPYVLIFGELVPMFAARLFPEHMARIGAPLLWVTSKIFHPFIRAASTCFTSFQSIFRGHVATTTHGAIIQLDELQEILHETIEESVRIQRPKSRKKRQLLSESLHLETRTTSHDGYVIDSVAGRILSLREKQVRHYMTPIREALVVHAFKRINQACTVIFHRLNKLGIMTTAIGENMPTPSLAKGLIPYILLKEKQEKIIGVVATNELFYYALSSPKRGSLDSVDISLLQLALPVCYVGEEASLSDVLLRMNRERGEVAFVIGQDGEIHGYIPMDTILEEVLPHVQNAMEAMPIHLEKTVQGDDDILSFIRQYNIPVSFFDHATIKKIALGQTFSQYIESHLGRKPNIGDTITLGSLMLSVTETTLLGAKTVYIETKSN